eukprot:31137-Pelagococcus_subviridis.AAC.4
MPMVTPTRGRARSCRTRAAWSPPARRRRRRRRTRRRVPLLPRRAAPCVVPLPGRVVVFS